MKRMLLLVAAGLFVMPANASAGWGHGFHHGGHFGGHYGGHYGHGYHSAVHFGVGIGHLSLGHSYHHYPRYAYAYPSYRTYRYRCSPTYVPQRALPQRQRPEEIPAPEPVVPSIPSDGTEVQAPSTPSANVKFAVFHKSSDGHTHHSHTENPAATTTNTTDKGSSIDGLGAQSSTPKSRTLLSDEEIPWAVE